MSAATKSVAGLLPKSTDTSKPGMSSAEFQKAHLAKKAAEADAKAKAKADLKAIKDEAARVKAEAAAQAKAIKAEAATAAKAEKAAATAAAKAERDAAREAKKAAGPSPEEVAAKAEAKAIKDAASAAKREAATAAKAEKDAAKEAKLAAERALGLDDEATCVKGNHTAKVRNFPTTKTGSGRSFNECRACRDARVKATKA